MEEGGGLLGFIDSKEERGLGCWGIAREGKRGFAAHWCPNRGPEHPILTSMRASPLRSSEAEIRGGGEKGDGSSASSSSSYSFLSLSFFIKKLEKLSFLTALIGLATRDMGISDFQLSNLTSLCTQGQARRDVYLRGFLAPLQTMGGIEAQRNNLGGIEAILP